ncbi:MAG: hypothetical protein WB681_04590 [Candidatus Cybelea sp.]
MSKRILAATSLVAVAFALVACGGSKSSNANATTAASTQPGANGSAREESMPNCGAAQAVWVNLKTKVYHEPGDPRYGKTKSGEYLCPSQAAAQGFRPAGAGERRRHHKKAASTQ